jgi:hypothetical protein
MQRKKLFLAILATTLLVGVVSAALIEWFGRVRMTATVKQAVLLDEYGYDYVIGETATVAGGESFCRYHWLQSQTSVPVALKFITAFDPDGVGIIVTYLTALLHQFGTGVAEWSTEHIHKGAYSVKLTTVTTDDIARAYVPFGSTTLAEIGKVSFWTYVTDADNVYVRPWVGIYLHTNPSVTLEQWFADYYAGSPNVFYIQAEPCYTDGYSGDFNVWQYWDSEGSHPLKWLGLESPDDPYHGPTLQEYIEGTAVTKGFASREYGTLYVVGIKFQAGYGGTWKNFEGFVDDVTIGNEPWDLELFPENTPFTIEPGERIDFFICYKFDLLIKGGTYHIYTTVIPSS